MLILEPTNVVGVKASHDATSRVWGVCQQNDGGIFASLLAWIALFQAQGSLPGKVQHLQPKY